MHACMHTYIHTSIRYNTCIDVIRIHTRVCIRCAHVQQMRCIYAYIRCNIYIIHQIRYIQTCNCDIQIIHQIRYDTIRYDAYKHQIHQIQYRRVSTHTSDAIRKYTHQVRHMHTYIHPAQALRAATPRFPTA